MLTISGSMARQGHFPAPYDELRKLFTDLPRLLEHVSAVEEVQTHGEGIYRIIMKRLGAMNYYVWLAYDVRIEDGGEVIRATSLPFDPADPWIGEGILLSEYESETRLTASDGGCIVDHQVGVKVHVPLPGFLQFVPTSVLKGAADALMNTELVKILKEMEDSALRQIRANA